MNIDDFSQKATEGVNSLIQMTDGIKGRSLAFADAFKSIGNFTSFEDFKNSFEGELTEDEIISIATVSGLDAKGIQNLQDLSINSTFDFSTSLDSLTDKQRNLSSLFTMDFSSVTEDDIKVFKSLNEQNSTVTFNFTDAKTGSVDMNIINTDNQISYKSLEVSKTLFNVIDAAYKTNKPVRVDFGKDVSVVLKIDKQGKVSAEFIPGDKAMEMILKNSLPELKSKLDEEELPYSQLSYKNFNENNKNKRNKEDNKDE